MALAALIACWAADAPPPHERNAIHQALAKADADLLPAPLLADGLDEKSQREALARFCGERVDPDELCRRSPAAPVLVETAPLALRQGLRCRRTTIGFVAYADLDRLLRDEAWRNDLFRKQAEVRTLAARDVPAGALPAGLNEHFSVRNARFSVLDRVEIRATFLSQLSRSGDSLVIASQLHEPLAAHPEFGHVWQAIDPDDEGKARPHGERRRFRLAASYTKATKLRSPAGAAFFEHHSIAEQPEEWFGGTDLVRSKLPMAATTEVRAFRRRLAAAEAPAKE